jgi:hypothetical protein
MGSDAVADAAPNKDDCVSKLEMVQFAEISKPANVKNY